MKQQDFRTAASIPENVTCEISADIIIVGDGMVPIDRCAAIKARLALKKKISYAERERMEIRLANWVSNGLLSDDEYRAVTYALETHA